ncbi:hypothetical protein CCMSSC00406_0009925 [Pleurotus cornucopiae]|uniref:Uncharacterized protein n=1 Tax=Pleurotus cornucopiae TaxID=5321 RepID=A0ACB7ITF6_PLECO|nr:hypothetical protein CCMSSC00406_0009925 [Pleurotus cornucopiae]
MESGPVMALDAILSLPLLNEVELSTSLLSLATLNILARLPYLESFSILAEVEMDDEEVYNLDVMSLSNAFPSLTTFSSETISFHFIVSFLEAYKPLKLHTLNVVSTTTETYETYRALFDAVVFAAPDIDDIHTESQKWNDNNAVEDSSLFPFFPTTRLCLWNITSLQLIRPPPLKLDVGSMRTLLTNLPFLVTLELDERTGPPILPLSALSELAPLCPVMKSLTLYLDTKELLMPTPPNWTFRCLEFMGVGISPLQSSAQNVATFLSAVLPLTC